MSAFVPLTLRAVFFALLCSLTLLAHAETPATRSATRPATRPSTTTASIPAAPVLRAPATLPAALTKPVLETPDDLKILQDQVKAVVAKASPTVVGVRVAGFGSGVIVSPDGYVLTAGHVDGAPGRDAVVYLPDGKRVKAKTLGVNYFLDSGMVKITDPGPLPGGKWPFAEMGSSAALKRGQWCIAMGHPGGVKPGRTAPVRLGRVLNNVAGFVRTECTLVGGDSGGPLFDLDGRVIGIHSRIGNGINDNMHVPVDTFRETWDKLARGDAWGSSMFAARPGGPYLGIQLDTQSPTVMVEEVVTNSPADKAGLRSGDIITKFDNRPIANFAEFQQRLSQRKVGDEVNIELTRGKETVKLKITLGRRQPDRP